MSSLNGINKKDYYLRQEIDKVDQFVDDSKVYGMFVDFDNNIFTRLGDAVGKTGGADFDDIGPWRRRRCNLTDDGVVLAYYGDDNYTEFGKTLVEIEKDERVFPIGTNVQVMVEQPKFYYKVEPLDLGWVDIRETWGIYAWAASSTVETEADLVVYFGDNVSAPIKIPPKSSAINIRKLLNEQNGSLALMGLKANLNAFNSWSISFQYVTDDNSPEDTVAKIVYNGVEYPLKKIVNRTLEKTVLNKANYFISPIQKAGYKIHPAFLENNIEVNNIYLSAYCSSMQNFEGDYLIDGEGVTDLKARLSSVSNVVPTSYSLYYYRRWAENRHIGWDVNSIKATSLTQLLFLVEYCSFNAQKIIGEGLFSPTTPKIVNGQTNFLGNKTGQSKVIDGVIEVSFNKKISYRGEEEFYGSRRNTTDGNITKGFGGYYNIYIGDKPYYTGGDIVPINYKKVDFLCSSLGGYLKKFGYSKNFDWLFLKSAINEGGNSNVPIGDIQSVAGSTSVSVDTPVNIVYSHSYPTNGFDSGFFSVYSSSEYNSYVSNRTGTRIIYIPQPTKKGVI